MRKYGIAGACARSMRGQFILVLSLGCSTSPELRVRDSLGEVCGTVVVLPGLPCSVPHSLCYSAVALIKDNRR